VYSNVVTACITKYPFLADYDGTAVSVLISTVAVVSVLVMPGFITAG